MLPAASSGINDVSVPSWEQKPREATAARMLVVGGHEQCRGVSGKLSTSKFQALHPEPP
jgi:hypothetical protein